MMMQKGADISGDVITNPTADVNPDTKRRAENVTNGVVSGTSDSDSDSDSDCETPAMDMDQVISRNIRNIRTKPPWKHAPRHFPKPWKPGKKGYPIFQVRLVYLVHY